MSRRPPSRPRGAWILRLYPRAWRSRYGAEVEAILLDRAPDLRARFDLLRGALDAHLHPRTPSPAASWAALIAGGAWTAIAATTMTEPVPPDWPGFLAWTLPVALVGAIAALVASLGLAQRTGDDTGRLVDGVAVLALLGQGAFVLAIGVAVFGGPYGSPTGAAQTVASLGIIALGLTLARHDDHPIAEAAMVAGAAALIPWPGAWLVCGVAWTGIGLWLRFEPRMLRVA
jgi:hypothetical protein